MAEQATAVATPPTEADLNEGLEAYRAAVGEALQEPEEPAEETAPEPEPQEDTQTLEQLNVIQQQLEALRTENATYRGLLQRQAQTQQVPVPEPEPPLYDKAAVLDQIRRDPVAAIESVAKAVAERTAKQVRSELQGQISREYDNRSSAQRSRDADAARTMGDFGDYLKNPEFAAAAETFYDTLAPQGKYVPGAMHAAASQAFATLVRSGKIQLASPQVAEAPKPKVFDIRSRAKVPAAPVIQAGNSAEVGDPLNDLTPEDMKITARIAHDLGIKQEEAIKAYLDERRKNPLYGSGV
jgi:hypothetical protein